MKITVDIKKKVISFHDDVSYEEIKEVMERIFPNDDDKDITIINRKIVSTYQRNHLNAAVKVDDMILRNPTHPDPTAFWNTINTYNKSTDIENL